MAKDVELAAAEPDRFTIIGVDTDDGPEHALWDKRVKLPLDPDLVMSIRARGVEDPIAVMEDAGKLIVVDGRRRVLHAREAAKEFEGTSAKVRVPYFVTRGSDADLAGISFLLNTFRHEDSALDRARNAARLLKITKSMEDVCSFFGKQPVRIKAWLAVAEADKLHDAIEEGKISFTTAIEIALKPREDHEKLLAAVIRGDAPRTGTGRIRGKKTNEHKGVLRSWMRKALKTKAAKDLKESQRAVLEWFATGEAAQGTWFDTFAFEAQGEIEQQAEKRKERGAKKAKKAEKAAETKKAADAAEAEKAVDNVVPLRTEASTQSAQE